MVVLPSTLDTIMKNALLLVLGMFVSVASAQDKLTYIPKNAYALLPTLQVEVQASFPETTIPEYFGGLIEHESCISLTHSRCWSSKSELNTSRELGVGLGQITKAYNADGSIRFDSLSDLRARHMDSLSELSWSNVRLRPDLQIRAILMMTRDNHKTFWQVREEIERFKMADAAYNAGPGRISKKRLQCSLTKGCDPQKWDDNVERINVTGSKVLYGNRTAHDIMTHHVHDVFLRKGKYIPYLRLTPAPAVRLGS
jgi:hypothetical protein